jgi:predicted branched-subunit amino acid permease
MAVPLLPGNVAWGLAFGAAAVAVGMTPGWSVIMSTLAFSGTAQLAALGMLNQPLLAIFLTSLLLSLRFVPMSLALVRMLDGTRWRRLLVACGIADASFAVLVARQARSPATVFGTWLGLYPAWIAGTAAGAMAAPLLPSALLSTSDGLVIVIFAVLAVEVCVDRAQVNVALTSAAAAVTASLVLPGAVALPLAAAAASAVGLVRRR